MRRKRRARSSSLRVTMKASPFLAALNGACIGSFRRAIGRKSAFDNNDELFVFHKTSHALPPSVATERIIRLKRRWRFQSRNRDYSALAASRVSKLQDCDHHHKRSYCGRNAIVFAYCNKTIIYKYACCIYHTVMLNLHYLQGSYENKNYLVAFY